MFATMKPYAAPPPPGAQPPPLWGDPAHLAALFGDCVTDVRAERHTLRVSHFGGAAEFRDYFKHNYGRRSRSTATSPTIRPASRPSTPICWPWPAATTSAAAPWTGSI
jgi:hypothetical protein